MQIRCKFLLRFPIVVWVNTYYDQSPVIQEQVNRHSVGCANWLDSEGLLQEYNHPHHHRKGLAPSKQRFLLAGENGTHV